MCSVPVFPDASHANWAQGVVFERFFPKKKLQRDIKLGLKNSIF